MKAIKQNKTVERLKVLKHLFIGKPLVFTRCDICGSINLGYSHTKIDETQEDNITVNYNLHCFSCGAIAYCIQKWLPNK